jgi:hypothetical protein
LSWTSGVNLVVFGSSPSCFTVASSVGMMNWYAPTAELSLPELIMPRWYFCTSAMVMFVRSAVPPPSTVLYGSLVPASRWRMNDSTLFAEASPVS